ncbi:hypothetical protein MKY87_28180 [Paenibacillus sp. FSL R7-0198]|uniref:hypothetical protein n=1 Tax=Paenibacillus sp. FSL R7-0198 TaxID=2921674 RepID=UPI0030F92280
MIDALREQITSCILDGNPIRIKIDLFYQNGREFYFGKKHGLHPVLVHGYDPSRDNIYIVDDISEYTEYCVPFTEFLEYFTENEAITDNSITQYVLKHSHSSNINEKVIQNFVSNLLLLESELFDSISNILQLADIYPFALKHEDLIETLSSTIYRKCSERYRLLKLLNLNNDSNSIKNSIIKKMDQVLDDWLLLRALSIKAIYTRNYGKKLIDNSRINLHRISKLEREYHILFYSLIHNFNFNFSAEQEFYH